MINTLINKQDTFEIIRDKIAYILVSETASQMAKAETAELDESLWNLAVYTERANPWERFDEHSEPIVNIWFDNDNFDERGSSVSKQKAVGTFNIDCYGAAQAENDPYGGHVPGDKAAALVAHRAARLVRNILMAAEYTYLGLQGTVWNRWVQSREVFQPPFDARNALKIVGARLSLRVTYHELPPDYDAETLESVLIDIKRSEDGLITLEADYDYT